MHDRQRSQPSAPARVLALGALALAIVAVAYVVLSGSSTYRVRLLFSDASGLVGGDQVLIGPSIVGTVKSISLTRSGRAAVVIAVDSSASPLYRGTVARIEENGLAGIASHYVTLQPASAHGNAQIRSGGTIPQRDTHPEVGLDQLLDSFNGKTRNGLRNIIRGEATSIAGKTREANRTLLYLDPLLQSTSRFTAALSRDEPAFDQLLVQGAQTMRLLASRSEQLTNLVAKADAVSASVAGRSRALGQTLTLLPSTLERSTSTFTGLRRTIGTLEPLVAVAKPQARGLAAFAGALNRFATTAAPTLDELAALLARPDGQGLTALLREAPALEKASSTGFPAIVASLLAQESSGQIEALRAYTPDIVAALANTGQLDGYYDANGHYGRAEPFYGAYGVTNGTLTNQPQADRYDGLTVVRTGRCPGGATQPGDSSMPEAVSGCDRSNTPSGP